MPPRSETRVGQDADKRGVSLPAVGEDQCADRLDRRGRDGPDSPLAAALTASEQRRRIGRDPPPLDGSLKHGTEESEGLAPRGGSDAGGGEICGEALCHFDVQLAELQIAQARQDVQIPHVRHRTASIAPKLVVVGVPDDRVELVEREEADVRAVRTTGRSTSLHGFSTM